MTREKIELEGWTSAFRSSTDYEADMVRDLLDSHGIPALVFTQRDHSFNVNVGSLARVYVMVPNDKLDEALAVLQLSPPGDDELERAAREADAEAPPAHGPDEDSLLDSAIEKIRFPSPESPPDDELSA